MTSHSGNPTPAGTQVPCGTAISKVVARRAMRGFLLVEVEAAEPRGRRDGRHDRPGEQGGH
jgi:hypothetical protein